MLFWRTGASLDTTEPLCTAGAQSDSYFFSSDGTPQAGYTDFLARGWKVLEADNFFLPAYIGIGEILIHEGKTKDAVENLKKVYTRTRSVIILHRLEELFLDQGEPSEIIRVYHDALQQDPQNPVLQFYLGKLYYRLEMVDEAFDLLSTIEGPQDHLLDCHKIMANLYLRKQQFEEAITSLKKALSFKKRVVVPYIVTFDAMTAAGTGIVLDPITGISSITLDAMTASGWGEYQPGG